MGRFRLCVQGLDRAEARSHFQNHRQLPSQNARAWLGGVNSWVLGISIQDERVQRPIPKHWPSRPLNL